MTDQDREKHAFASNRRLSEYYRRAIEGVSDYAVFLMDASGIIQDWNHAAEQIKGYLRDEVLGNYFGILYTEEAQRRGAPSLNLWIAAERGTFQEEAWRRRKDGSLFWAHVEIIALYDEAGSVLGYCKITQDLTDRKMLEDQLQRAKRETQTTLEVAHAVTWKWDCLTDKVSVSPTFFDVLGYKDGETPTTASAWFELVHPEDRAQLQTLLQSANEGRPIGTAEFRLCASDGTYRWFLTRPSWWPAEKSSQRCAIGGVTIDIHEKKSAELERELLVTQLRHEKDRALVTLSSIGDAVVSTDEDGHIVDFNDTAARLTGWPADQATGRFIGDVLDIVEEGTNRPLSDFIVTCLKAGRATNMSPRALLRPRSGGPLSIEDVATPIRSQDGDIRGLIIVFRDVSESRRLMQTLAHQATHDSLTGLVNRSEFESRVRRALENNAKFHTDSALLYMDLDQFKIVNDSCGHKAGDELLRQLSQLFRAHVRERDTLARLGGDEFALLIEHCTVDEALRVANKVLETTREFQFPFNGRTFRVGASIGLVPLTPASQSVQEVLQRADHACYTAKETGRNRVHIQHEGDEQLVQRQTDMQWVSRIGDALHDGSFQLFHQKIAPMATDGGKHYEILLRMKDDSVGWALPGLFLPAAERYDLMPAVDRWVLEHALKWLEAHPRHVDELDLCAINLSARTLVDEHFQDYASRLLYGTSVPCKKLCFEITETAAITNLQKTAAFIERLKKTGCQFALDDFGTGMASFTYLMNLPVDYIKIDGSFVSSMHKSPADTEMVRSVNRIGHLMGKKTVAEWVTDEPTLKLVSEAGTDFVQGFWIAEPAPLLA